MTLPPAHHFLTLPLWSPDIKSDVEPRKISIQRGQLVDTARGGRAVPYKLYIPETILAKNEKFPVVLWSHGLGGSRDGAGFISRFVASHGYIVLHVQHAGTDSGLWEGKPGHPWDIIKSTHIPRHATLNRLKDIPFVLDRLPQMECANMMDFDRMGMSGHSFGAMTTQIMAGQLRGFGRRQYSLHEPRFKAGILYSPVPNRNKRTHRAEDFYGLIKIPLMIMTGTDDGSPLENFGYEERLEVFEHSGGPDQFLLVLKDGDHMVYNGSRGKLEENPKRSLHEEIIKLISLAFWDAYLKKDDAAKNWLHHITAQWLGAEGDFRSKNILP